jgi:hypothetical protein
MPVTPILVRHAGRWRLVRTAIAVCVLALLFASPIASASTLDFDGDSFIYTADSGEANDVSFDDFFGNGIVAIADDGIDMRHVTVTPRAATICDPVLSMGIIADCLEHPAVLNLGDGDDHVRGSDLDDEILGGDGNDQLEGGPGRSRVRGSGTSSGWPRAC